MLADRRPGRPASIALAASLVCGALGCTQPNSTEIPSTSPSPEAGAAADNDAILAASNLPETLATPLADDPMQVTVHRLSNGMTVYISTDRQKPRFDAWIAVRTGSRNDPADSTGLAHYLEHMLFKGTDELGTIDYDAEKPHLDRIQALYGQLKTTDEPAARAQIFTEIDAETQAAAKYAVPNEMTRLYTAMGVSGLNAFTSWDQTVYIANVPSNRFEAWAMVEGERFADPVFRLFYPELEAVYEEKNLSLDDPDEVVFDTMTRELFPGHPYGTQTTIGEVEHLKNPAYDDMAAYFDRWYVPNNMAIVLAGDIDAETALPVLERALGGLEPAALEPPIPGDLRGPEGRVQRDVEGEGEQKVMLGWRVVDANHPDAPALEVMDAIVDNSDTGLLNVELELSQKLPSAGAFNLALREGGAWIMEGVAREGQSLDEVEQLLLGVVAKLEAGEFTQADVDAVILHRELREKQLLERTGGRVSKIAAAFIEGRDWIEEVERDRRLRAVTREDVIRVANEYLGGDLVVVRRTKGKPELPDLEKPKITPVPIDERRESPFARKVESVPATELEPQWLEAGTHYELGELPAGRYIAARNDRNDLFTVSYEVERGTRQSRLLCFAFEALEQSGTADMSAAQLRKELYALGASVDFGCGTDSSQITISGVDGNLEPTLALVERWVRDADIDPELLEAQVGNELSERKDRLDDSRWLGWALSDYGRQGKDSWLLQEPSDAQLRKARPDQLEKLTAGFFDQQHETFYFGPRAADAAGPVIARGTKHRKVEPRKPERYRKLAGAQIYFLHRKVAKSDISITIPLGPLGEAERPAARVLGEYLSGSMSAKIFQEIREARGLAYRAYGLVTPGERPSDDWAFMGSLGTQVDKTPEALRVFVQLIVDDPLDATSVEGAKASLEQEYRASRVDPRWIVGAVDGWVERGLDADPRPAEREKVATMTVEQVQAFADRLDDAPLIITIVGHRDRVDLEALKKIAPVIEVKAGDLFSY